MPFWKCAVLAILAIPRYACVESEDEPEQSLPEEVTEEDNLLSPEQLHKITSMMDADSNGKVSLDEVLQFSRGTQKGIAGKESKTVLEEMDSDKDGKISLGEMMKDMGEMGENVEEEEASARKAVEETKFKAADADGDGLLNVDELSAVFYPETHIGVLRIATQYTLGQKDTDGDGLLTAKEFWEGDQVAGEEIGTSEEEVADFQALDKDGSGKLDLEELTPWESGQFHVIQSMQKFLKAADKDDDQHMTPEEVAAAHSSMAGTDAHYHFMEWAEHHEL